VIISGEQGWFAGVAVLIWAALAPIGCGGETSRPHDGGAGLADATVAPDSGVLRAENTPDGLVLLTVDQAAAFDELWACGWLSLGPDGGVLCDITPPTPPAGQVIDPNRVNLAYDDGLGNSYLILLNWNATCDRGWQFTDATESLIHICQITCDVIRAHPGATITLMIACSGPPLAF
jgi:hypothetical protein